MKSEKFQINAQTLNAMVASVGALAMVFARQLTPEQRAAMATDLAALAENAQKNGDATLETLLIDMHNAIR